jgi:hypothetical protein
MVQPKKTNRNIAINLKLEKGLFSLQLNANLPAPTRLLLCLFMALLLWWMPELLDYLKLVIAIFR